MKQNKITKIHDKTTQFYLHNHHQPRSKKNINGSYNELMTTMSKIQAVDYDAQTLLA